MKLTVFGKVFFKGMLFCTATLSLLPTLLSPLGDFCHIQIIGVIFIFLNHDHNNLIMKQITHEIYT